MDDNRMEHLFVCPHAFVLIRLCRHKGLWNIARLVLVHTREEIIGKWFHDQSLTNTAFNDQADEGLVSELFQL